MKCNEQMNPKSFSSLATTIAFLFLILCSRVESAPQNTDRDRLKALWKCTLKQPDLKYAVNKLIDGKVMPRDMIENIFDAFDEPGLKIPILPNLSIMGIGGNPGFYRNDQHLFLESQPGSSSYDVNKRIALLQEKQTLKEDERYRYAVQLLHYVHLLRAAYADFILNSLIKISDQKCSSYLSFGDELWALSRDPENPTEAEKQMAMSKIRLRKAICQSHQEDYRKARAALASLVGTEAIVVLDTQLEDGTNE